MNYSGKIINNNYIIREKIFSSLSFSLWEAQSIYSVKKFLILFIDSNLKKIDQSKINGYKNYCFKYFLNPLTNLNSIFEINFYDENLFISSEINEGTTLFKYLNETEIINFDDIKKIIIELTKALADLENNNLSVGYFNPRNIWLTIENNKIKSIKLLNFGLDKLNEIIKFKLDEYENIFMPSAELSGTVNEELYSLGQIFLLLLTDRIENTKITLNNIEQILNNFEINKNEKNKYLIILRKLLNKKIDYKKINDLLNDLIENKKTNSKTNKNIFNDNSISTYQNNRADYFNKSENESKNDIVITSEDRINYFNKMNRERILYYDKSNLDELNFYFNKLEQERKSYHKKISFEKKIFFDTIIDETKIYLKSISRQKTSSETIKFYDPIKFYEKISEDAKKFINKVSFERNSYSNILSNELKNNSGFTSDNLKKKNNLVNSIVYNINRYTDNVAIDSKRYFINITNETKNFFEKKFKDYKRSNEIKSDDFINEIINRTIDYFDRLEDKKNIYIKNITKYNKQNFNESIPSNQISMQREEFYKKNETENDRSKKNKLTNELTESKIKSEKISQTKKSKISNFDFINSLFLKKNELNFLFKLYKKTLNSKGNICFIKIDNLNEFNYFLKTFKTKIYENTNYLEIDCKEYSKSKKDIIKEILNKINKKEKYLFKYDPDDIKEKIYNNCHKKKPIVLILKNIFYINKVFIKLIYEFRKDITKHALLIICTYTNQ